MGAGGGRAGGVGPQSLGPRRTWARPKRDRPEFGIPSQKTRGLDPIVQGWRRGSGTLRDTSGGRVGLGGGALLLGRKNLHICQLQGFRFLALSKEKNESDYLF